MPYKGFIKKASQRAHVATYPVSVGSHTHPCAGYRIDYMGAAREGSVSLCTVSVGLKQFQMSPEMRPGDEARKRSDVRVRQKRQFRGARQPSRTQPIEIGPTSSSQPMSIRDREIGMNPSH